MDYAHAPLRAALAIPVEVGDDAGLEMALRFKEKRPTPLDLDRLATAFDAWMRADGDLSLERCLHIPPKTSPDAWRLAQRDLWLRKAASLIDASGPVEGARALGARWDHFLSPRTGPWYAWRDGSEPPADATPLSVALFYASRYNRSSNVGALTERRLRSIVGSSWPSKFPANA